MAALGPIFLWMICVISLSRSCQAHVPQIEECLYVDAFAIECWWKRPRNSDVNYSLEYKNLADPKPYPVHKCSPNKIKVNLNGEEIESCSVPWVTMYAKFLFNLTSVCQNESKTLPCLQEYGNETDFWASEQNVVLRTPPSNLKIEKHSRLLWDEPFVRHALLSYVLKQHDVKYKVMLKLLKKSEDSNDPVDDSWTERYVDKKRFFVFSGLVPGRSYVARVCITLVKPEKELIWSLPSKPIQFKSPSAIIRTVPHLKRTPGTGTVAEETTAIPERLNKRRLVLIAIIPILAFLILFIVCYILICGPHRLCPTKVKIPKPFLMIAMTEVDNREDYIQNDFDNDKEADLVPLSTQLLGFPSANHNAAKRFGTSETIKLLCGNERYVENGHHQRCPTVSQGDTSTNGQHANENPLLLQNESPRSNFCSNGIVGNPISNGNVATHCNGTNMLSHENEIKNTLSLSLRKHSARDSTRLNELNCKEMSHHLGETPPQPLETTRLFHDIPHIQDGRKHSCHIDESKCRDTSECMDYVIDSSMSSPINENVVDEDDILGKPLEEAKRVHLLNSESKEKIPDYVTQMTCFGRSANDQMVTFVAAPKDAMPGCVSSKSICAYADATEKMRHLLEHMQAQKTCPFCMKNSTTIPSRSPIERKAQDSTSYQVTRIESLCSDTSSLDSGYSPDSTTST